ncbi:ion transporter [Zooshikella ganghwensis]|uniref:ion transporter n=1 Tax=Zooshikella ganghwensis TaxID=202772 RepID=UPI001F471955|nr:ion transporter [Zooshikella ganghwensis]
MSSKTKYKSSDDLKPQKSTEGMSWSGQLTWFINHPKVQNGIVILILLNAILLGIETWQWAMESIGWWVLVLDQIILTVFVIEITARLIVHRLEFWKDPWSIFDFSVVVIALLPATGSFAVLRALRVLRVLRLLTTVPSMRKVVSALLKAIPGLGSIALLLLIIYYVFAVIATNLFGEAYPEWFGNIGQSLYTLFQIMTLESWSMGIARPVMENFPFAWAFFVPFILIATFTMLNLFIAIIVNAIQDYSEAEHKDTIEHVTNVRDVITHDLHQEVKALRSEISELKSLLVMQSKKS